MPDDRRASSESAGCWTREQAVLSLAQQQRLDRLRERHCEIEPLDSGPGGTFETILKLRDGMRYIFHEDPDKLLDRIEEIIGADQDSRSRTLCTSGAHPGVQSVVIYSDTRCLPIYELTCPDAGQ